MMSISIIIVMTSPKMSTEHNVTENTRALITGGLIADIHLGELEKTSK